MTEQQIGDSNVLNDKKLAKQLGRESTRIDQTIPNSSLMIVEFLPEAILKTTAMQEKQGVWKFRGFEEETQTATLECRLGSEDPITTKVRFVSDDIVCMIPPNISVLKKELLFRRLQAN